MISEMCFVDILARSGATSFFKVEKTRSLEADDAGAAKTLMATLNNVGQSKNVQNISDFS